LLILIGIEACCACIVQGDNSRMEEMDENQKEKYDDEISLKDLFMSILVIFLRYRKLIVVVTLCSIILAAVGYFVYPAYQASVSEKNPVYQGRMLISTNNLTRSYYTQKPESFFYNANYIMDALRSAGLSEYASGGQVFSLADESQRQVALDKINNDFIAANNPARSAEELKNNIYRAIPYSPTGTTQAQGIDVSVTEIIFKGTDSDLVASFLNSLYTIVDENIKTMILPAVQSKISSYELLSSASFISEATQDVLNAGLNDYLIAKEFMNDNVHPLLMLDAPLVAKQVKSQDELRAGFKLKAILIVFAGFFVSFLIACGLNFIRNIKNDEDSMKIIREALENPENNEASSKK
jgi:hypothetical protein